MAADDIDRRWTHGMNGWRVYLMDDDATRGEVSGFDHARNVVFVVRDGETEACEVHWTDVRPL